MNERDYTVDLPRTEAPGEFQDFGPFTKKEAVDFAAQWGADPAGRLSLISKIGGESEGSEPLGWEVAYAHKYGTDRLLFRTEAEARQMRAAIVADNYGDLADYDLDDEVEAIEASLRLGDWEAAYALWDQSWDKIREISVTDGETIELSPVRWNTPSTVRVP